MISLAVMLLVVSMCLGAFDTFYFHIYRCRLYAHPEARTENLFHGLRALVFGGFFLLLLNVRATGAFWWLFPLSVLAELVISAGDVLLETTSRKGLGGLPRGEYVLHVILPLVVGAGLTCMLLGSYPQAAEETALGWQQRPLGAPLLALGYAALPALLGIAVFDISSWFRLGRARERTSPARRGFGLQLAPGVGLGDRSP
jgi:hypothetical protein